MANTKEELVKQQVDITINNKFIDALAKQLTDKQEYGLSFPPDYNVSNALMGAYLVLKETKDKNNKPLLESCTQASVANSLMDMATLGLSVQKKQGYFIAYGNSCMFQKSYFGNIAIARRYGLKTINAEVIYDKDTFSYRIEDGIKVLEEHKQNISNIDNNKIIGAYAVATMNDGSKVLEVMNIDQIKQAWKQGFGYKEGSGTHAKFSDQMSKKTVINRCLKGIINTHGDVFVQTADEATEDLNQIDVLEAEVSYEINKTANSEEFAPAFDADVVEEAPAEPVNEPVAAQMDNKPSSSAKTEIPAFMKAEVMD